MSVPQTIRRLPARAFLLLRRGVESVARVAGTRDAAQVAFFALLSFPAALLLAVWAFSTALDDPGLRMDIVEAIVDTLPLDEKGQRDVEEMLDGVASGAGGVGLAGALVLLYSASGAIGSLRHAVNQAFAGRSPLPYVPGKALDAGLTLIVGPLMLAILGLSLLNRVPAALDDEPLLGGAVGFLVTVVTPAALLFAVLVGLYRVLPAERAGYRAAGIGALAGIVGLGMVQLGAEAYFDAAGDGSAVYGTLGALLVIALSTYVAAIAVVFGAHVAAEAARLPSGAAIDRELEAGGEGPPLHREIAGLLRGLVLRRRPKD